MIFSVSLKNDCGENGQVEVSKPWFRQLIDQVSCNINAGLPLVDQPTVRQAGLTEAKSGST